MNKNFYDDLVPSIELSLKFAENDKPHSGYSTPCYSKNIANLCHSIKESGSLNAAAKEREMSYTKAWKLFRECEGQLGVKLLERNGAHGSTLTEEGEFLLALYDETAKKAEREARTIYRKRVKSAFPEE